MGSTNDSLGGLSEAEAAVYDRQLRVWGVETQKKMSSAKVLVIGLTGLAAEACKNIVLAGVGTVTLVDNVPKSSAAPGNFLAFMEASPEAQTVAEATAVTLREMNPFCKVEALGIGANDVTQDVVTGYDTVLVCGQPLALQERLNDTCRSIGARFYAADCRSSSAHFFADLGPRFMYTPVGAKSGNEEGQAAGADPAAPEPQCATFVPLSTALAAPWSSLPRRGNKLAPALCAAAGFERESGRAPTAADVPTIVAALPAQEKSHGVKAGFVPPAVVEDFVGVGYEMPAISSVVGGLLGQELLKSVTGRGEPICNLFVYSIQGGSGNIENLGCDKDR